MTDGSETILKRRVFRQGSALNHVAQVHYDRGEIMHHTLETTLPTAYHEGKTRNDA